MGIKKLVWILLLALVITGCSTNSDSTEAGEEFTYQATDDVKSYKFAKPDGDYSELKVDKEQNITGANIALTFNNFWTFEEADKVLDENAEILEEDVLTYSDRTCNYILYTNGLAKYTDTKGRSAVLTWKSQYVK